MSKVTRVNRLEIIDHTESMKGREYVKWEVKDFNVEVAVNKIKADAIEEAVELVKDSWSRLDIEDLREYIKKLRGE